MKIIVFNQDVSGGIAEYSRCQAVALSQAGCEVVLLTDGREVPFLNHNGKSTALPHSGCAKRPRFRCLRLVLLVKWLLVNQCLLFAAVVRRRPDAVLLASYIEYLSPVWVWLQLLAARMFGVTFVAVLHDPVRNFVVGPSWWHKLSVIMAYRPLSAVFVHEKPPPEAAIPSKVSVYEVPHGLFLPSKTERSRDEVRNEWGVPQDAIAFLSFGFIRDSKNIDLLIRALPDNPEAFLVVMGRLQSESVNKPVSFYEKLARELGIAQRVKFFVGFVPDEKVLDYMRAADAVALTYAASFRSQSGVLNSIAHCAKPVLASAGPGALKQSVERFGLGEFVVPDNAQAVSDGMGRLINYIKAQREGRTAQAASPRMDWSSYCDYASWKTNARVVVQALTSVRQSGGAS